MNNLFFVYGTLKWDLGNHGWLHGTDYVGPARLDGYALYDLPYGFPAMVPQDGGKAFGEVYRAPDPEAMRDALDILESEGRMYDRITVSVDMGGGAMGTAWAYAWRGELPEGAEIESDGHWYGTARDVDDLQREIN